MVTSHTVTWYHCYLIGHMIPLLSDHHCSRVICHQSSRPTVTNFQVNTPHVYLLTWNLCTFQFEWFENIGDGGTWWYQISIIWPWKKKISKKYYLNLSVFKYRMLNLTLCSSLGLIVYICFGPHCLQSSQLIAWLNNSFKSIPTI